MILVDTGVWIDWLRGTDNAETNLLSSAINRLETIAFTGHILQELMQGCSTDREANQIETHFAPFIELFPRRRTYRLAAKIYRDCRNHGFTIRSSIDGMVAACAIENDCALLQRDRDFKVIQEFSKLKILS
jgi:predicted nucleic acid-binding protein